MKADRLVVGMVEKLAQQLDGLKVVLMALKLVGRMVEMLGAYWAVMSVVIWVAYWVEMKDAKLDSVLVVKF